MFKAQIFCIVLLSLLAANFFSSRMEKTKANTLYSALLITSIIHLFFDIATVYTINHPQTVSPGLNYFAHQLFFGTMLLIFYIIYLYIIALIESEINSEVPRMKYALAPFLVSTIGVMELPLRYMRTSKGSYSYGIAVTVVYISIAVYIVLIFRLLLKYRKRIPWKKTKAIMIALTWEVVISTIQRFSPTWLISSLGILLINYGFYITVENPDAVLVEQLRAETARADAANNAKTSFLANVSHEIRTPINAVLGMDEMILRESGESVIRNYAFEIKKAAKSLLNIINDLLDITKIEAGKLNIIPVKYSLASLINDVHTMLELKAADKGLKFTVDVEGELPSEVIGDDIRLRQILLNLLNNAVKYTNEGGVTLCIKAVCPGSIYFCVKDTGIGIKQEDIKKLYTPFERIEELRNRNIEGTGLGLNITMQLLKLMGSELKIESVYGKGSEFSFIIEQEAVDPTPIDAETLCKPAVFVGEEYTPAYQAPEARLLIVDDNDMNRKVLKGLLKETKVQVFEAQSGKECLKMTDESAFDLILMDHMMPEMDGTQTLNAIRSQDSNLCKNTPVVIVTANAVAGAKESYLKAGFNAFLSKPIDPEKLENLVFSMLDKRLIQQTQRSVSAKRDSSPINERPVIEGIDWNWAKLHFKDENALNEAVYFFYDSIDSSAEKLDEAFAQINSDDGLNSYRIQVHSMKNSAAIVGIVQLAGMAMALESAARNGDCSTINAIHPLFIKKWLGYLDAMRPLMPEKSAQKRADDCQSEISAIFEDIRHAACDMDVDALDELSQKLDQYSFDKERQAFILQIKAQITNFEVEKLMTCEYR